jgi:hypothetical protein
MDVFIRMRAGLLVGFLALPIILIGFTAFQALTLGNIGLFVLFLGQITIVPAFQMLFQSFLNKTNPKPASDLNLLVPSTANTAIVGANPSWWLAHVSFYFGYLITNASWIVNMAPASGASEATVKARKSRAITILVILCTLAVGLLYLRWQTGSEDALSLIVGVVPFAAMSVGWFWFAKQCGARDADVFSIITQIVPEQAQGSNAVMSCVYSPKS